MPYISRLPTRSYPSVDSGNSRTRLRDITFSIRSIRDRISDDFISTYQLTEGERPEDVSEAVYEGDPNHYWVILLLNDVVDPFFDWYLTQEQVWKLAEEKYDDIYDTHHYVDEDGYWVNSEDGISVSNIEYEIEENDKKREIVVLKPRFLQQVINQLERLIEEEQIEDDV